MLSEWIKAALDRATKSQTDLARELSAYLGRTIDRAAVNKMISGRRAVAADELLAIAQILGVEIPSGSQKNVANNAQDVSLSPNPIARPTVPVHGKPDMARGNRVVFSTNDQVGATFSPPGLDTVPGIWATYVHTEEMLPRYRPGEMVWMNPNQPVKRGDDVLVKIKDVEPAKSLGIIREFVAWEDGGLVLAMHNPARKDTYAREDVLSIDPIVFCSRV